jgi:hypothetical protein
MTYTTPSSPNTSYNWSVTGGTITTNSGTYNYCTMERSSVRNDHLNGHQYFRLWTHRNSCHHDSTPHLFRSSRVLHRCVNMKLLPIRFRTASGNTKAWTVTGGQVIGSSTGNSIVVAWNTSGTGQVSVTEIHGFGCDSSASRSVTVGQSVQPQTQRPGYVCAMM